MKDYVITVVYHNFNELTAFHVNQFIKYNPGIDVVPIKSSDFEEHNAWRYDWMWAYCDNIFYRWFLSDQKILANKYFIFDYDTLCRQSVKDFYQEVWNERFVSSVYVDYDQNKSWYWFNFYETKFRKSIYQKYRAGALPMSGMMMQHDDAKLIIETQIKDNFWKDCISELRIGTILKYNNIKATSLPRHKALNMSPFEKYLSKNFYSEEGIFHPVKKLQDPA